MKNKLLSLLLFGILAGAQAQTTYNIGGENNLYLGFYAASEVSTKSVLINIGTSADVINGFDLDLRAATALTSTYGLNWFNNSQVYWSLIGYDGSYGEYGSFYVGRPTAQPLLQTDILGSTALTEDQYWALSDKVGALTVAHNAFAADRSSVIGSAGNTHQISVVDNSPVSFQGMADANFSAFTSAVYEQVVGGLSIQRFEWDGTSSFPTTEGSFSGIIQSNGIISFKSLAPPPSVYNGPWNWMAGSGNWSVTNNWTSNQVASNGFAVGITGAAGGTITNDTVTSIASLTYSNGAGSFTLTGTNAGQTLTIAGGITNNSSATQTISLGLNTASNQTFSAATGDLTMGDISNTASLTMQESAGRAITVNGAISGTGSLNQSGAGTLNLNSSNSYSGGTTLNGGTVVAGNSSSFGGGGISVASNAVIAAGAQGISISNAVAIASGSTATIDTATTSMSISGAIAGSGSLAKAGTGTLSILGNSASFSGATAVNAGRLQVSGNHGTGTVTVGTGASLAGTGTVGGISVASGGTVMAGTDAAIGTLSASGNALWNGGGNYHWKMSDATGSKGVGFDTLSIGGGLDLSGLTASNRFQINLWSLGGNAANFNKDADGDWQIASFNSLLGSFSTNLFSINLGATNGTGGFLNALNGNFSLTASANALFLSYKTLAFTDTGGIWSGGSGNLTGITNGSLLQFTGAGGSVTNQSVTNLNGIVYDTRAGGYTLSGTTLTLSGGVTNSSTALQTISSALRLASNAILQAQNGAIQIGGSLDLSSNNLTIAGARQSTLAGDIAGSGTLIKQGTGTLVMTGVASNAGGLTVESGRTILSGGDDRLSSNGRLSVSSGAVADLGTTSQRLVVLSGSGTVTGGGGTITLAPSNTISFAGTIAGQEALLQSGSGTTVLSGSNSYSGGTIVNSGTLVASNASAFGSTNGSLNVAGGTLDLGRFNQRFGSVTLSAGSIGNGTLTPSSGVTVTGNSNSTISATLAGNGGLTKSGLGTLNLATALPTGSVRITGGTMQSSASVVGATANTRGIVTVSNAVWTNSGQLTVGGSGSGSLTVGSGGTVAASGLLIASNARSIGTVTIGDAGGVGSLTLGSGSISFGAGTGSLVFNQSGESTLSSTITSRSAGKGRITGSGTGTTTLSANNSGFSGTTLLSAGTVALGTGARLGGTVNVANRNASIVLRDGSSLTGTNKVTHAVAGKLVDNTGLAFTNAIRGKIALSATGSLEKSYSANSSVAGFGAGIGAGRTFSLLSGSVTNSAILEAKITAGALDFKGTYSNNIVMAITDPSFSAIRNTIQWYDPVTQTWKNTVEGNTGNKTATINGMNGKSFAGSFNTFLLQAGRGGILDAATDTLAEINALPASGINLTLAKIMGAFGYDKSTKTSWAVINHNSLFSGRDLGYSSEYDAAALNHSLSGAAAASTIQTVPEPGTWALMIVGGIALGMASRVRRQK